ncbi:MAG: hypothetical protein ACI85F_003012 [Bacteroidia bacterium]|jgi:hypothetical protein
MKLGASLVLSFLLIGFGSGCKDSCIDCTIEHFLDLSVIAEVKDICGDDDELATEESNLSVDYRCVQCVVFLTTGNYDTGILCGTRAFTDSVEDSNAEGAIQVNTAYACEFFSDTLIITCHLSQE